MYNYLLIYFSELELHRGKTVGTPMPLLDGISVTRILLLSLSQQSHKKKEQRSFYVKTLQAARFNINPNRPI